VIPTQDGGSKEVNLDFTTVTLKVQPRQAEEILMAQKLGVLTAVLRNPTDDPATPSSVTGLRSITVSR
jgi:pilus assembly protein CpaB